MLKMAKKRKRKNRHEKAWHGYHNVHVGNSHFWSIPTAIQNTWETREESADDTEWISKASSSAQSSEFSCCKDTTFATPAFQIGPSDWNHHSVSRLFGRKHRCAVPCAIAKPVVDASHEIDRILCQKVGGCGRVSRSLCCRCGGDS